MAPRNPGHPLPESDEAFDAMLKGTLISMLLVMLQDADMEIRRLAMSTLNSAAHNKPDLILPHLGELVPFVLSESVIKPELIKEVTLGPFKHLVDDGLEVRKVSHPPPTPQAPAPAWPAARDASTDVGAERIRNAVRAHGDGLYADEQH